MALRAMALAASLLGLAACASFQNMQGRKGNDFYLADQHQEAWGAPPAKQQPSALIFFSSQDAAWPSYVAALNAALEKSPQPGLLAIDLDISDPAKSASDCERLGAKFSVAPGTPNLAKAWGASLPLKRPYGVKLIDGRVQRQAELRPEAGTLAKFFGPRD